MEILIVGCGGIGGYFGARLIEAGAKVSYLVRAPRAKQLLENGLTVSSARGDVKVEVNALTKAQLTSTYDLVILTCKSYDLTSCIEDCKPAIGSDTFVLPMLNGLSHYQTLVDNLPQACVLYGYCNVSAALTESGDIQHYNLIHEMTIGVQRPEHDTQRLQAIIKLLKTANFNTRFSQVIQQEMWEKFVFINSLAGTTILLDGEVGQIVDTNKGTAVALELLKECQQVASSQGFPIRARANKIARDALSQTNSPLSASMFKDMQNQKSIESNLVDELCGFAELADLNLPLMTAVQTKLEIYQNKLKDNAK